jgi:hypothetical protein
MKQHILQRKSIHILFALAITLVMIGSNAQELSAQTQAPQFPILSISGGDGYNDEWYPDGRIWTSYAHNGEKELLIPIFMDNSKWKNYEVPSPITGEPTVLFDALPIKSFQFSLLYQKNALEFVGYTTDHPKVFVDEGLPFTDEDEPCLATGFDIDAHPQRTDRYMSYIRKPIVSDLENGMSVKVTGASTNRSLPLTSGYQILMYLKFRVKPTVGESAGPGSDISQLIIDNDTIRYNNRIATKELPFIEQKPYSVKPNGDNFYESFYPFAKTPPNPYSEYWMPNIVDEELFPGLAGMNNYKLTSEYLSFSEPILPGMIYLIIKDEVPPLEFNINRFIGQSPAVGPILDDSGEEILSEEGWKVEWEIKDPITADDENFTKGSRICEVRIDDTKDGLIMKHIEVESSEEWLEFKPVASPITRSGGLKSAFSRKGTMNWLDKGTLTNSNLTSVLTVPSGDGSAIQLEIQCDASKLAAAEGDEENNGIYTGYLSFSSPEMLNSPVRLKVTFIYFKSAQEGVDNVNNDTHGMKLAIRNSRGIVGDVAYMVFGTGDRATNGVDTLYGEYAFATPISGFGARFYPLDKNGDPLEDVGDDEAGQKQLLVDNGFGDWSATDEDSHTDSRDIRSSNDTNQSIIYYVKFNENGDENYPVVVEWNTNDFLDGAQLFIRDTENGQAFQSVSMWEANNLGNGRRSFAIQDPKINEFLIEYTLPKVIEYVDENGDPIIKSGWNLLSLPVKPINTQYDNIYTYATIVPIRYRNNVPQAETELSEGVGYFIKYSSTVDKQFAGTYINEISLDKGNAPRVVPGDNETNSGGWNTIGALSVPVATSEIDFDPFQNSPLPSTDYTEEYGVWGYTNGEGYQTVYELLPGLGYWIKVDNNGYYKIEADLSGGQGASRFNERQEIYDNSEIINIGDNSQNHAKLYLSSDESVDVSRSEMPPTPMEAIFDVRFNRGTDLDNVNSTVINMQAITYPISISLENDARFNYTFFDAMSGEKLGEIAKGQSNNVEINSTLANQIRVERSIVLSVDDNENIFNLTVAQNPVVDENVNISFTLTNPELVTLSLYDNMGNKVGSLSNDKYPAGTHSIGNAYSYFNGLTNGQYILRMDAGQQSVVTKVQIIK